MERQTNIIRVDDLKKLDMALTTIIKPEKIHTNSVS
jgi:hypothetical protein